MNLSAQLTHDVAQATPPSSGRPDYAFWAPSLRRPELSPPAPPCVEQTNESRLANILEISRSFQVLVHTARGGSSGAFHILAPKAHCSSARFTTQQSVRYVLVQAPMNERWMVVSGWLGEAKVSLPSTLGPNQEWNRENGMHEKNDSIPDELLSVYSTKWWVQWTCDIKKPTEQTLTNF